MAPCLETQAAVLDVVVLREVGGLQVGLTSVLTPVLGVAGEGPRHDILHHDPEALANLLYRHSAGGEVGVVLQRGRDHGGQSERRDVPAKLDQEVGSALFELCLVLLQHLLHLQLLAHLVAVHLYEQRALFEVVSQVAFLESAYHATLWTLPTAVTVAENTRTMEGTLTVVERLNGALIWFHWCCAQPTQRIGCLLGRGRCELDLTHRGRDRPPATRGECGRVSINLATFGAILCLCFPRQSPETALRLERRL
mmetsp:Transcript_41750/g.90567  ORF Transcript_41750/g.90567 Transcript_41750/m.90567 type:complete len:253 (-) Transcript_41750:22-780(-)